MIRMYEWFEQTHPGFAILGFIGIAIVIRIIYAIITDK